MLSKDQPWRTVSKKSVMREYKPISDYAIVGDRSTCALIGIDGSVDWLCVPRFDSPSVFGSLLDIKKGGRFTILPKTDGEFEARQYYDGETNILLTEFMDEDGSIRITDFMPCFRVSGVVTSSKELHRRVTCLQGKFELDFRIEPKLNYGSIIPKITKVGRNGYSFTGTPEMSQEIALISPLKLQIKQGSVSGSFKMKSNESLNFALRLNGLGEHHSQETNSEAKLTETKAYWKSVAANCDYHGKWREYVVRSALLLHLLVFSSSGAVIAAPTTSLPEEIGGGRNWDYRYSWIRDSSFVLWLSMPSETGPREGVISSGS